MGLFDFFRKKAKKSVEPECPIKQPKRPIGKISVTYRTDYFPHTVIDEVIYIEPYHSDEWNDYINVNYDEICEACESKGLRFVYLPKHLHKLLGDEDRFVYNVPNLNPIQDVDMDESIRRTYAEYYEHIQQKGKVDINEPILLFTYNHDTWLYCTDFDLTIPYILDVCHKYDPSSIRYCKAPEYVPSGCSPADWAFEKDGARLQQEIIERVAQLRAMGVEEVVIQNLFKPQVKLSRLQITSDYRILLPDYDIEIKMPPLYKALYLLYLEHEEGIMFKCLIDYRDELLRIYNSITHFDDSERIERSIDMLVNPMCNSVNEKCSRIREAFVSCLNDDIAKNYYITGGRCEPKRITLDRSLVSFE